MPSLGEALKRVLRGEERADAAARIAERRKHAVPAVDDGARRRRSARRCPCLRSSA